MRPLIQFYILWEKEIRTQTLVPGRPCEGRERRRPPEGQGERPQKKPSPLVYWSQTFSLPNCEKIRFCCLSHPLCGTWLELPRLTEALKEVIAKVKKGIFLLQLRAWQELVRIIPKPTGSSKVCAILRGWGGATAQRTPPYLHHRNVGVDRRPHCWSSEEQLLSHHRVSLVIKMMWRS